MSEQQKNMSLMMPKKNLFRSLLFSLLPLFLLAANSLLSEPAAGAAPSAVSIEQDAEVGDWSKTLDNRTVLSSKEQKEEKMYEEQRQEEQSHFAAEFKKMLTILFVFIGALMALSWAVKRVANARIEQVNAVSSIKVLEKRSLSPKGMLYLVEVEGKRMLIAESPAGINSLGSVAEK